MRTHLEIVILIVSTLAMVGAAHPWRVQAQPYIHSLDCTNQDGPRSSIICASIASYSSTDSLAIIIGTLEDNTLSNIINVNSFPFDEPSVSDIKVVHSGSCTYILWSEHYILHDRRSIYYSYICSNHKMGSESMRGTLLIGDIKVQWLDINTTVRDGEVYVLVPYRRNGWRHTKLFKITRASLTSEDVPLSSMSAYEQVTATRDSLYVGFVGPSPITATLTERTKANNLYITSRGIKDDEWRQRRQVKIQKMRGPVHFPDLYVENNRLTFSYMMKGLHAESTVNSMTLGGVFETLMTLRGAEEIAVPRYSYSVKGLVIYMKRTLLAQHARTYIIEDEITYVSPKYDFRSRPSIITKTGTPVFVYADSDGEVVIRPFYTCSISDTHLPCSRVR